MIDINLLKQDLIKKNIQGIGLDIDETLAWTCRDWFELMLEKFGNPENLTPEEMAIKYKLVQNVPYWKTEETKNFIDEKINCPTSHKNLSLVNGADHFVNKLNEIIPVVAYITVRPKSMIEASLY